MSAISAISEVEATDVILVAENNGKIVMVEIPYRKTTEAIIAHVKCNCRNWAGKIRIMTAKKASRLLPKDGFVRIYPYLSDYDAVVSLLREEGEWLETDAEKSFTLYKNIIKLQDECAKRRFNNLTRAK